MRSSIRLIARDLVRLIGNWWRSDRVRVSRLDGEHLRWQPGDVIWLDGRTAVVRRREVMSGPEGTRVEYIIESEQ